MPKLNLDLYTIQPIVYGVELLTAQPHFDRSSVSYLTPTAYTKSAFIPQ
jgi:hypothetical protein